jgi:hypothetical protein
MGECHEKFPKARVRESYHFFPNSFDKLSHRVILAAIDTQKCNLAGYQEKTGRHRLC